MDKKIEKYKKLVIKPFEFTDDINYLLRYKKFIPAFILLACKVEVHCYNLVQEIQKLLNSKFENKKEREKQTFGELIGTIFENNKKMN